MSGKRGEGDVTSNTTTTATTAAAISNVVTRPRRLILWCLPRTGSTAIAKCLSFLDQDTELWFEPFNMARITALNVEKDKGITLPKQYTGNEAVFDQVAADFQAATKCNFTHPSLLSYEGVKTALERSERGTVVVKEMAVATDGAFDYMPAGFKHVLLIRDPVRVVPSFRKMNMEVTGEAPNADIDLQEHHPYYPRMHWYGEMNALWKHIKTHVDPDPFIIDSEDLLANPAPYLRRICEEIGIEYRDDLLTWDASTESIKSWKSASPEFWTSEKFAQGKIFKRAYESSGFGIATPKPLPTNLTPDCARIIPMCRDAYDEMYPHRFIP